MKQKMSFKKFVLSKEGAEREQKRSKKGAKREQRGSSGGRGGAYASLDPSLRRILKDLVGIWIKFLESV